MKQLTTIKYDVKQLCAEVLEISVPTFRAHRESYMEKLKSMYHVEIEIGARGKEFFILEPIEDEVIILKDVASDTKLKKKTLKNIELILKAVLIDKVLPRPDEIVKSTKLSKSTVSRCIVIMRENNILYDPPEEIIETVNKFTGEIYEYTRKKYSFIYYDIRGDERVVLEYPNIHNVYGEYFSEKMAELMYQHKFNFNYEIARITASAHTWKKINETFELEKGNRVAKWLVSSEYRKLIKEKHNG